jgi:hypothetical protein
MAVLQSGRRRLVTVVAALGLFVAVLLVQPTSAFANAGGSASCVGLELSDISPPGTNDEFPDGGPGFVAEVTELAAALGFNNRGDLISFVAKLHEGSHENCDKALGLG